MGFCHIVCSRVARWTVAFRFNKLFTRKETLCETILQRAHPVRPAEDFFGAREGLRPLRSLRGARRRSRTVLLSRAPRPWQVRTDRASRPRSRSRCALTGRTANFALTLG